MRAPPGRASDLEAMTSILERPYGMALLSGEPGSGISDLGTAWRASAASRGWLCGSSRVPGLSHENPLVPLFAALLDAVEGWEGSSRVQAVWRTVAAPQAMEFPLVHRFLAPGAEIGERSLPFPWDLARLDRFRAMEAAIAMFRVVAAERPLAISILGLDWASPLLVEYLEHLLLLAAEVPFAVLATSDLPVEGTALAGGPLGQLEPATGKAGSRLVTIDLQPLSEISLEEVLSSRYPHSNFTDGFKRRLFALAQGNPGRMGEMCRRLEEGGIVFTSQGGWFAREDQPWPFPETVSEYRLSPVLDLSAQDFELLEFWAGGGGPIPAPLVARPETREYLGIPERSARKALGRMESVGVVETIPGGWRIRDPALVAALRQETDPSVRGRDLGILGRALADPGSGDPLRAARLLEEAGDLEGAVGALRSAADGLEKSGAWGTAAECLARSRLLAARCGREDGVEERIDLARREGHARQVAGAAREAIEAYSAALVPAELLDLHGKIAGLLCRRGACRLDMGDPQGAGQDFEAAREAAGTAGSPVAVRLALLGSVRASRAAGDPAAAAQALELAGRAGDPVQAWLDLEAALVAGESGRNEDSERALLELLESTGKQPILAGRILGEVARLHLGAGRIEEALKVGSAAVQKAQETGDALMMVEALATLCRAADSGLDREASRRAWGELFGLAGRVERRDLQLVAAARAGELCLEAGLAEAAVHFLDRATGLARGAGQSAQEAHAQMLLGRSNLALAKLYEAQSDFEEAGKLALLLGDEALRGESLLGLGRVYAAQRKRDRARETLSKAREVFRTLALADREAEAAAALTPLLTG